MTTNTGGNKFGGNSPNEVDLTAGGSNGVPGILLVDKPGRKNARENSLGINLKKRVTEVSGIKLM